MGDKSECYTKLMTEVAAGNQMGNMWAIYHPQQLACENANPSPLEEACTRGFVQGCEFPGVLLMLWSCREVPPRGRTGCRTKRLEDESLFRERPEGNESVRYHGLSQGVSVAEVFLSDLFLLFLDFL